MAILRHFFWNYNPWSFSHIKIMREIVKKSVLQKYTSLIVAIFSGAVGLVNGLLGAGGGSLVVPLYQTRLGMEAKKAHATAIATMLPQCIISSVIYLIGQDFDYVKGGVISSGVVLGGILGALLLKVVNSKLLSFAFYAIMIYSGIKFLV